MPAQIAQDPREIVANAPMTWRQVFLVALCVILNGLDGFDVLSISFASPGISRDWGIDRAQLGVVLSMELIGMSFGSIVLGRLADRIGRRITTILCLTTMGGGMFIAAFCDDIITLGIVRLITGIGIGGMLAAVTAIVAGVANARYKSMAVTLMAAGYPLGAVVGGTIVARILVTGDWRDIFLLGAGITLTLLPIAWFALPESFDSIMRGNASDRLEQVNRSLQKLGHQPIAALATIEDMQKPSYASLFSPALKWTTILLTLAYCLHIFTFYFLIKWIPKIVADLDISASSAASVLVWANVGGASGSLLFSLLTARLSLRSLTISCLALSGLTVAAFGFVDADSTALSMAAALAGFFTNAAIVGFYALLAAAYPPHLRGTGTGIVIGVGRGGSALGPIVGGLLFTTGLVRNEVTTIMALGSILACVVIYKLSYSRKRPGLSIP